MLTAAAATALSNTFGIRVGVDYALCALRKGTLLDFPAVRTSGCVRTINLVVQRSSFKKVRNCPGQRGTLIPSPSE